MAIKVKLIRHGKSTKAAVDMLRQLSPEGAEQANKRRAMLGNPTFDLVVASPTMRTRQTAAVIAGLPDTDQVFTHHALIVDHSVSERGWRIDRMFNKVGYAALPDYFAIDYEGDLIDFGRRSWLALREVLDHLGDNVKNVLVVGHAVYIPMTALVAVMENNDPVDVDFDKGTEEMIRAANIEECGGFEFEFANGAVLIRSLKRLESVV